MFSTDLVTYLHPDTSLWNSISKYNDIIKSAGMQTDTAKDAHMPRTHSKLSLYIINSSHHHMHTDTFPDTRMRLMSTEKAKK